MSGCPLVNNKNQVIGICSHAITWGSQGANPTISCFVYTYWLERLIKENKDTNLPMPWPQLKTKEAIIFN
jgi:hypothetical protein